MSERIRLIDALRGLPLAGIAMAHFGEQYLGFIAPPGQPYNIHGPADGVLEALSEMGWHPYFPSSAGRMYLIASAFAGDCVL
jgi:hypothetical protein